MSEKYYIYGSMVDRGQRTECVSMSDVMGKFKEVVRVYRQRGNTLTEGSDGKWVLREPSGKLESLWIENEQGQVVKTVAVE